MEMQARLARREERRRALRRRRRLALLALLGMAGVIAAVLVLALGGGGGSGSAARVASSAARARARAHKKAGQQRASSRRAAPGRPGTEPVPILMYHVIATPPAGAPFPGLYVPPAEFAAQMRALKAAGWHAVTLDEVQAYWRRGIALPPGKPIVVSFDNGYNSQYTQALPVLRELGWVGVENLQLSGLPPSQGGLGQGQIHGLISAGWELDTQGFSHADLVTLDAQSLRYQVAQARTTLRQRYHVPVNWFCYPSGHYDAAVVAEVRAAGFTGSTTVVPGWAHPGEDPYRLHRLRVLGGTDATELLSLIAGIRQDPPAPATYGS